MISHEEFNVSKEIEFPNKNMFPYDVTGSCGAQKESGVYVNFKPGRRIKVFIMKKASDLVFVSRFNYSFHSKLIKCNLISICTCFNIKMHANAQQFIYFYSHQCSL